MLFLKFMLLLIGLGVLAIAAGIVLYDIFLAFELDRLLRRSNEPAKVADQDATAAPPTTPTRPERRPIRWQAAARLAIIAALSMLAGASIVVVPDGRAAVRISQISGVRPGTLYAGTHFILPLFERVDLFDIRDRVFATSATEGPHEKLECLTVQLRRLVGGPGHHGAYRIDPRRLDYIQANLPQPVDDQIVAPVVTSVFANSRRTTLCATCLPQSARSFVHAPHSKSRRGLAGTPSW